MPADQVAQPWTLRSTLIAVSDLERSIAFYQAVGPFEVLVREDAVVVLGSPAPISAALILRETRSMHSARHGPDSLGLRSVTFNVGTTAELDRIESVLRARDALTTRRQIEDGGSDLVLGRDPDNLPLAFVRYAEGVPGPEYYKAVATLVYALDR